MWYNEQSESKMRKNGAVQEVIFSSSVLLLLLDASRDRGAREKEGRECRRKQLSGSGCPFRYPACTNAAFSWPKTRGEEGPLHTRDAVNANQMDK